MNRIAALNSDSSCDYDDNTSSHQVATKEAQESEAFALHKRALLLQQKGDNEEAKEILRDLIKHPLIQQSAQTSKDAENVGPGQLLKYSTYKNLAVIATQEEKWDVAMDCYQEAIMVDASDVSVWYKMGTIALKLHNYPLAQHSFEEALVCNPRHWPSIDQVITVLYALGDYATCLRYISKALHRDDGYVKGHCFMKQIYHEHPSLQVDLAHFFKDLDSDVFQIEVEQEEIDEFVVEAQDMRAKKRELVKKAEKLEVKFKKPLLSLTWNDLGECIIDLYDSIDKEISKKGVTDISKPQVTLTSKVDISQYKDLSPDQDLQAVNAAVPESTNKSSDATAGTTSTTSPTKDTPEPMDTAPHTSDDGEEDCGKPEEDVADVPSCPFTSSIKKAPGTKKGAKRKNEWWYNEALKRRSSRVRNTAVKKPDEVKIDYGELIKKILPQALLVVNEDEDKPVSVECNENSTLCDESKMETGEEHRGHLRATETTDVLSFLNDHQNNCGVLDLLNLFVFELAKRESLKWPAGLQNMYIKAYERYRNHFVYPNFLSKDESDEFIHDMAMMCLVYSELKLDSCLNVKNSTPASKGKIAVQEHFTEDFYFDLEYLIMLSPCRSILAENCFSFSVRTLWCKARYLVRKNSNDLAIIAFERVIELLENEPDNASKLTLVNCQSDCVISKENAVKHMDTLVCTQSLDEVHKHHSTGDHEHVVTLLLQTFTEKKLSSTKVGSRHEQLLLLQDSLLKLKDFKKCMFWLEVSFNEALQHYCNSHKESTKQEWLSTIAKLTDGLETCLTKRECYKSLLSKNRLRLTENLLKMLEIATEQSEFGGDIVKVTVMPWILLYWLIKHEEEEQKESSNFDQMLLEDDSLEENMPASLVILNLAHDYVSRQSRCTLHDGRLLLFTIHRFTLELASVEEDDEAHPFKEELQNAIEQCFFCLYGHPNKRTKAKHLTDHNAPPVPLSWERCAAVFDYFKPNSMPEYDSYRTSAVSAELENLLCRIFQLIPPTCGTLLTADCISAYIEGTLDTAPSIEECKWPIIGELYYLLADYYFKNKEQGKAIKFYMRDLTVNPDRFDSWAGMALARSSKLEQKLNSHELKNEPMSINKHAVAALRCFKRALDIDSTNGKLWMEHGSLAYQLHSHASRQLKQQHMFPLGEFLDTAKSNRRTMLELARKCYTRAGECDSAEDGQEELWLQHYMMGKIGEKMKVAPQEYLDNYRKAAEYLHEDRAKYPKKINYIYSPPHLAVEALEMHFRLHASVIKYLWNNYSKGDDAARAKVPFDYLEKLVSEAADSGFAQCVEKDKPKRTVGALTDVEPSTSTAPTGVGRPRKRPKLHHPDHTYSKAKVSSESSQESCDAACNSPLPHSASTPDGTVASPLTASPRVLSANPFPLPPVPLPANSPAASTETVPIDTATCIVISVPADSDAPKLAPITEKTPRDVSVEDKMETDDSPPVLTKSQADGFDVLKPEPNDEAEKEAKDDLPVIEKMEPPKASEEGGEDDKSDAMPALEKMDTVSESAAEENDKKSDIPDLTGEKSAEGSETSVECLHADMKAGTVSSPLSKSVAEGKEFEEVKPEENPAMDTVEAKTSTQSNEKQTNKENTEANEAMETEEQIKVETDAVAGAELVSAAENKPEKTDKINLAKTEDAEKKSDRESNAGEATDVTEKVVRQDGTSEKPAKTAADTNIESEKMSGGKAEKEIGAGDKQAATDQNPQERYHKLMWRCMQALEICLSRFPQHFKSLYRLTLIYAKSDFTKQLQWARDLLLGPQDSSVTWPQLTHMPCQALFQDRKNTNFFNGLWRIPIEEIDRSGSFTSHLTQSIHLLYDILTQLNDSTMLFKLCTQLAKTPEQGKKYLRDLERVYLSRQAYIQCLDVLEKQVANYKAVEMNPEASPTSTGQKFLLQVHKVWRHGIAQQIEPKRSNKIFSHAFSAVVKGEPSPSESAIPGLLEQAIKHCQELTTAVNPGPGRPKLTSRADDKKKAPGSEASQKRPSTPSRPIAIRVAPKPVEEDCEEAPDTNGHSSDSSYKATEDSESSSSSDDETGGVICISDSPLKSSPNYVKSPGCKTPPLLQRANIFSVLKSPARDFPAVSAHNTFAPVPSSLTSQSAASLPSVQGHRHPHAQATSTQHKPPPTVSPRKAGESDSDCVIILESD